MSLVQRAKNGWAEMLAAFQFLTRISLPSLDYRPDSLAGAVKFFPLVGGCLGAVAAIFNRAVAHHLPRLASAFLIIVLLVVITGALHEDGLADAADGIGGGHTREKILLIFRDSRIGSYGAAALCLSLVGRLILIASLPAEHITKYLIVAGALCRWTILPLSYFLPAAREADGQGARIAQRTSRSALIAGTAFAFAIAALLLRWRGFAAVGAAVAVSVVSGYLYRRKIGGVTGDCFGATAQIAETAVYVCGVWVA